ncbi:hypothetical protein T11_5185, partial [Trichinella zimbabwensis]
LSWTKNGRVVQRKTALGRTKSVPFLGWKMAPQ